MKTLDGLVTMKMAAKALDIAVQNVRARIDRGTLEGVEVDGKTFVTVASIKRVLRERKNRGERS
jgi:hypothetical protein